MKNALIVLAVTLVCFVAGGGYRLFNTSIEDIIHPHHAQGDDLSTDIYAYEMMFIFCGGAGAVVGAGVSILTLYLLSKRKKNTNPNPGP